jgi:hypothetical protein
MPANIGLSQFAVKRRATVPAAGHDSLFAISYGCLIGMAMTA